MRKWHRKGSGGGEGRAQNAPWHHLIGFPACAAAIFMLSTHSIYSSMTANLPKVGVVVYPRVGWGTEEPLKSYGKGPGSQACWLLLPFFTSERWFTFGYLSCLGVFWMLSGSTSCHQLVERVRVCKLQALPENWRSKNVQCSQLGVSTSSWRSLLVGGRILGISKANSHYINLILSWEKVRNTSVSVKSVFILKYKMNRVIRHHSFTVM